MSCSLVPSFLPSSLGSPGSDTVTILILLGDINQITTTQKVDQDVLLQTGTPQ